MLIQLRQSEIEQALKRYIQDQGISLHGKTIEISFTSGRKDNGVSADLDINEVEETHELTMAVSPAGVIQGFGIGYHNEPPRCTMPIGDPEKATDETNFPQDTGEPVATVETKTAASLFG